jgi:hypothetical protein
MRTLFNDAVSTAAHISKEWGERKSMQSKMEIMRKETGHVLFKETFPAFTSNDWEGNHDKP